MLGLRLNHPSSEDGLEILPNAPATRAEAAWSFAHVLHLDAWSTQSVAQAAADFTLPTFTSWQQRILTTAVSYVGYPYIWGGTSPTHEVEFGVPSAGGFDCSGFVWRVYKLTSYSGERGLAGVLRGRTTYQMSGEVPRSKLISIDKLQPADVMFFGAKGPRSKPERRRPHGALPRQRLVHPIVGRGRDAAAVRRLVPPCVRVGAAAVARSRAGLGRAGTVQARRALDVVRGAHLAPPPPAPDFPAERYLDQSQYDHQCRCGGYDGHHVPSSRGLPVPLLPELGVETLRR